MKTAIYIEDGVLQVVLTPESGFEKNAIDAITDKSFTTEIIEGSFYDCRGGWVRQKSYVKGNNINGGFLNDKSLIIKASKGENNEIK